MLLKISVGQMQPMNFFICPTLPKRLVWTFLSPLLFRWTMQLLRYSLKAPLSRLNSSTLTAGKNGSRLFETVTFVFLFMSLLRTIWLIYSPRFFPYMISSVFAIGLCMTLNRCDASIFTLGTVFSYQAFWVQFSPILENGWALLGDLDRYCAVSAKRFSNLTTTRSHLSVDVLGVPSDTVHVTALQPRPNTSSDWEVLTNTVRFSSQCSTKSIMWQGKPTACVQHVTFSYD